MTWLADLKRVVEGRTKGGWFVNGYDEDTIYSNNDQPIARFERENDQLSAALLGSVADELVEVLEAVEECRELRGNPFSAENLDTALSRLAAAVERAKA